MVWLLCGLALAHKPSFSNGEYSDVDSAFFVAEPAVSIVLYHEVTCDDPELWMVFPIDPEEPLYVQLGVPVIDRLQDYRPAVAVLAPGLPPLDASALPFVVPDGLGGIIYDTIDMASEEYIFYEPFTQTESWIYVEDTITLPESGLGYVVSWDPDDMTGKLWVATGTVEDFSDADPSDFAAWLPAVKTYHETADDMPDPPAEETVCTTPPSAASSSQGCTAVAAPASPLVLLLAGLVGWARRRPQSAASRTAARH